MSRRNHDTGLDNFLDPVNPVVERHILSFRKGFLDEIIEVA